MSDRARIAIASLALSAAGLIALVSHEGFRDKAYIPVPGDRPTVGFGSTYNLDGTPVKMGDTATPQKALRMSLAHIGKDEPQLGQLGGVAVGLEEPGGQRRDDGCGEVSVDHWASMRFLWRSCARTHTPRHPLPGRLQSLPVARRESRFR